MLCSLSSAMLVLINVATGIPDVIVPVYSPAESLLSQLISSLRKELAAW